MYEDSLEESGMMSKEEQKRIAVKAMKRFADQKVFLALSKAKIKVTEATRDGDNVYLTDKYQHTEYIDYNDGSKASLTNYKHKEQYLY